MKHTPGTWEAVEVGQGGPADNPVPVYEVLADGYKRVCEYVSEADARLIAAAPDMYRCTELLESLCAWMLHRFEKDSAEEQEAQFRLSEARAAIAKATA